MWKFYGKQLRWFRLYMCMYVWSVVKIHGKNNMTGASNIHHVARKSYHVLTSKLYCLSKWQKLRQLAFSVFGSDKCFVIMDFLCCNLFFQSFFFQSYCTNTLSFVLFCFVLFFLPCMLVQWSLPICQSVVLFNKIRIKKKRCFWWGSGFVSVCGVCWLIFFK
jgi:hypothetical protein